VKASFVAFCCLMFVSALPPSVSAQSGPPSLCKPCLFYGGDYNPSDPNSVSFSNENTLTYPNTRTYGAILMPPNHTVSVEGILFQIQFVETNTTLDPDGVTWEIRTGLKDGSGGTVVASGKGPVAKQATGRTGNGFEYTVRVKLDPPVQLTGSGKGTLYWFNLTPQCINKNDPVCATNTYTVSNTTGQTNSFRPRAQAVDQIFFDNRETNWQNVCQLGLNGSQCGYLSFGLTGTIIQ
jgi:hypothetical protein